MAKSYVIGVSFRRGCYRHIRISGAATLRQLHQTLAESFGFDGTVSHMFFPEHSRHFFQKTGSPSGAHRSDRLLPDFTLEEIPLVKGDRLTYVPALESPLRFSCRVLRETEGGTDTPAVLRSVGTLPVQSAGTPVPLPPTCEAEQLAGLYRKLHLPEKTVCSVHRYFEAASHLYGILPLRPLLELYNHQNPPVSQEDFLAIAEVIRHEPNDFCILSMDALYEDAPPTAPLDRQVVSLAVLTFGLERYYDLAAQQAGKPWPVLSREEFLAYLDPCFYPATPQNLKMLTFLQQHLSCPRQAAEDTLRLIQTLIWAGCEADEVVQSLDAMGVRFRTAAEQKEFSVFFRDMARHTRTVGNRGQSAASLSKQRRVFSGSHRRMLSAL